jgi:putative endonuclease
MDDNMEKTNSRGALGRWGEQHAANLLESAGMHIVERNWRCARGEIDIIAIDERDLVIVEVKTRRDDNKGSALAAVTPDKLAQLRRLAIMWLAASQRNVNINFRAIRVDIVAITRPLQGKTRVLHVRGVE